MSMSFRRIFVLEFCKGATLCRVNASTQGELLRKHKRFEGMGYTLVKMWRENAVAWEA